jgi:UDP-3-O-[3-hydroxymyristoyl] N-acetylglucosamine deacetylase
VRANTAKPFTAQGVGLHTGLWCELSARPTTSGGLVFVHEGQRVPAIWANVNDTQWATTLGGVKTVEHLLAALHGLHIDHLEIEVDGPEIPVLDGSSKHWVERIEAVPLDSSAPVLVVDRVVEARNGDRWMRIEPGEFELDVTTEFPIVGRQRLVTRDFNEVAWARTFGFRHYVEALRAKGLIQGGTLETALVYDENGPMNPPRAPDEVVRHKVLDLFGDLALVGARLQGKVTAVRPGHGLTRLLLQLLMQPEG